MRYLVTGGAGFVGSHLVEDLLNIGRDVTCLDDFSTGKEINIRPYLEKIRLVQGDIREKEVVLKSLEEVDYVFHLAAQISVSRSMREPDFDASININGFINLLESVRKSSVKRIVYVSTGGAIYGEPEVIPAPETTPEEPISAYGLSKLVGEKYLEWYHKTYGISYSIIRPANIYGPRQDPLGEAGVISIFLGSILGNKPLNVFGDGTDTRDYIYVKDITEICVKAMESDVNEKFNAGTGVQTSLLELIETIENVTNFKAEKKFLPPRPGDVKHIALENTKAKKLLNWEAKTSLRKGIAHTWDWFQKSS
ncbi:MAG: NAD-dependent epimerase/dehydratase family protein [Candidatus Hodarchaeales archaeon]